MRPVAVVFGECAGWYHPVTEPSGRCVVMCGADGYEGLCAHRPWRELAVLLAEAGLPVLRFDPPGAGDSGGPEEAAPDLQLWAQAVVEAAAEARRLSGATEVSLVGLRLGTVALALAAARVAPAPMALLFPVLAGRAQARGLRVAATVTEDGPEIGGFPWSEAALDALSALAPAAALRAAAPRPVLMLARPEMLAAAQTVASSLPGAEAHPAEGYGDLLAESHAAEAPRAAYEAIRAFLTRNLPPAPAQMPPPPATGVLRLRNGVTERAVRFGEDGHLVGAWTEPPGGSRPGGPALLIPTTAASHHYGNGRLLLGMARQAAAAGWSVLRFDGTGVGESENPAGIALIRLIYQPIVISDGRAALDWLQRQGHSQVAASGLCAGGWASLQIALTDPRVTHAIPLNMQAFIWREGRVLTVPAFRERDRPRSRNIRWELLAEGRRHGASWRDLLSTLLPGVARRTGQRALAFLGRRLPLALLPPVGPPRVVGWLRRLTARGTRITLAYSEKDPGMDELEAHFGPLGRHLAAIPGTQPVFVAGADHILSTRAMRRAWTAAFFEALGIPPDQRPPPPEITELPDAPRRRATR